MVVQYEEELEYERKHQMDAVVKNCIHVLLEKFWVLREVDEKLFFQIKDNETKLKNFFMDTFRYKLISTHELVKLEKIPVVAHSWMGEKYIGMTPAFKTPRDFSFFFWLMAFLENVSINKQFNLKSICEFMEDKEEGKLVWKEGIGYQNRLTLVRVLKYAEKMNLMVVDDEEIEGFFGDDKHDVLFRKTPYCPYFFRNFSEDATEWGSLDDFFRYLDYENNELADRKHRYYRKLFIEPIVYHRELTPEEQRYVETYKNTIDTHLYRTTNYDLEMYRNTSMLVKNEVSKGEVVFPAENMQSKIVLLFAKKLLENPTSYPIESDGLIRLTKEDLGIIFIDLCDQHKKAVFTKKYKDMRFEELIDECINELKKWGFAEDNGQVGLFVKEGLFRIIAKQ